MKETIKHYVVLEDTWLQVTDLSEDTIKDALVRHFEIQSSTLEIQMNGASTGIMYAEQYKLGVWHFKTLTIKDYTK